MQVKDPQDKTDITVHFSWGSFNKFPNYFLIYGNCRHYPTGNMQITFCLPPACSSFTYLHNSNVEDFTDKTS